MTLKQYLLKMKKFVDEHPEALELLVVTAKDNEGNAVEVEYNPSVQYFDGSVLTVGEERKLNAVCLN